MAESVAEKLVLKLFVTGRTVRSDLAISNLYTILEQFSPNMYDVTVVDVLDHPQVAEAELILATPTLIKLSPFPPRRIIGSLADHPQVFNALDINNLIARKDD